MTSRYEALQAYLRSQSELSVRLKFDDVARIVDELPQAAFKYREWWANSLVHTHARHGWMRAGWKTSKVDMEAREVTFTKMEDAKVLPQIRTDPAVPERARSPLEPADLRLAIEERAGGLQNLWVVVLAIEQYLDGDLTETELGRLLRKRWPRGASESKLSQSSPIGSPSTQIQHAHSLKLTRSALWQAILRLMNVQSGYSSLVRKNPYTFLGLDAQNESVRILYESGNWIAIKLDDVFGIYSELYRIGKLPREYFKDPENSMRVLGTADWRAPGAAILGMLPHLDPNIRVDGGTLTLKA